MSIERETFPLVAARGRLYAMPADAYWLDTGRPELYLQANLDVLDGLSKVSCPSPISPSATVSASAVLERSVVADDVVVGEACVVRNSVLLPGARLEAGAQVFDSVVAGRIGAGANATDVVIGAAGVVEPGASVRSVRLPAAD